MSLIRYTSLVDFLSHILLKTWDFFETREFIRQDNERFFMELGDEMSYLDPDIFDLVIIPLTDMLSNQNRYSSYMDDYIIDLLVAPVD